MKKIILAVVLLSLIVFPSIAQKKIKRVQVNSKTIAAQPAGKAYAMNLTRAGTIYTVAADADYNRVMVRTSSGEMSLADLIKKSGKNISGQLSVGRTSDIRAQRIKIGRTGGGLNFDCGNLACSCSGDDDCNDMFTSDKCGPIAICYPDGCVCLRF